MTRKKNIEMKIQILDINPTPSICVSMGKSNENEEAKKQKTERNFMFLPLWINIWNFSPGISVRYTWHVWFQEKSNLKCLCAWSVSLVELCLLFRKYVFFWKQNWWRIYLVQKHVSCLAEWWVRNRVWIMMRSYDGLNRISVVFGLFVWLQYVVCMRICLSLVYLHNKCAHTLTHSPCLFIHWQSRHKQAKPACIWIQKLWWIDRAAAVIWISGVREKNASSINKCGLSLCIFLCVSKSDSRNPCGTRIHDKLLEQYQAYIFVFSSSTFDVYDKRPHDLVLCRSLSFLLRLWNENSRDCVDFFSFDSWYFSELFWIRKKKFVRK